MFWNIFYLYFYSFFTFLFWLKKNKWIHGFLDVMFSRSAFGLLAPCMMLACVWNPEVSAYSPWRRDADTDASFSLKDPPASRASFQRSSASFTVWCSTCFFHYNFLHPSEAARVCTAVNDTCERLCPSVVCFNYNFKTYVHLWLQLLHQTRRHKAAKMVQKDSTHCTAGGIYGVFMGEDEVKHEEMFQEMKR